MGLQDRISKAFELHKRKIFDYKVFLAGTEHQIVRLKISENKYGDETEDIIDDSLVVIYLDLPPDIPMTRLRTDSLEPAKAATENVFLFDLLPIQGYSRFQDTMEKGDLLIKGIRMDNFSNYFLILEISEILGTIVNNTMTWRKFNCAPYNKELPSSVREIIAEYKSHLFS